MIDKFNKLYEKYVNDVLDVIDISPNVSGLNITLWMVTTENDNPNLTVYKDDIKRTGDNFSITVSDNPKIIGENFLSRKQTDKLYEFIKLNKNALVDAWNFDITTDVLFDKIKQNIKENKFIVEMANLPVDKTGLKKTTCIVPTEKHGPRIKIYKNRPSKYDDSFTVTIEDKPKVIGKVFVNNQELKNIQKFIILNKDLFLSFWNSKISTDEMLEQLRGV